ncbi:MAG: hypothetical protein M3273_07120, partial [Actinomycetota bacterium]|nr:hypothetical protein [Actinomycetota bacterium]
MDLRALVRQGAALLMVLALVLLVFPGVSQPAQAAGLRLYLHNYPTPPTGDTAGTRSLPMDGTAPTATTLYEYNVDEFSGGRSGRYVHRGSITGQTESNLRYMINWVFQAPQEMVLTGTAVGGIWISQKDGCNLPGHFHLWLRTKNNAATDSGTLIASGEGPVPASGGSPPCGWGLVPISMPVSTTVPAGTWVELKLTVDNADRDAAMVAYDTTSYASYLDLPLVVPTPEPTPTPTPTPTPDPTPT